MTIAELATRIGVRSELVARSAFLVIGHTESLSFADALVLSVLHALYSMGMSQDKAQVCVQFCQKYLRQFAEAFRGGTLRPASVVLHDARYVEMIGCGSDQDAAPFLFDLTAAQNTELPPHPPCWSIVIHLDGLAVRLIRDFIPLPQDASA